LPEPQFAGGMLRSVFPALRSTSFGKSEVWRMIKWRRGSALGALFLSFSVSLSAARSQPAAEWPNTFVSRIEALALIQTLSAEILASRSATSVLEEWCASHRLAGTAEPVIVAHLVSGEDKTVTAEQRQRLEVAVGEEVKFRRVQLLCGDRIFSEADNWYVPGRLTATMNQLLEKTTTPFGKAVRDLQPYRRTFEARVLWWPVPKGWETKPMLAEPRDDATSLVIPNSLFEHRAILYTKGGKPFSEVYEVYSRALLDFRPPSP
jgi:chorismate-pyruvate lyase